ncbi:MAG: three-Cys-motif partner protein TcmP [Cyclobacteriaceae bacterium]|nr:three-Cys-motif partner protein TcmP [Cyclobacteriaceae bacterium]
MTNLDHSSMVNEPDDSWGGPWTEKKLNAFSAYVWSYLSILKTQPQWKTIYFDGFAGSGARKEPKTEEYKQLSITEEDENIYKGAAERVLTLKDDLLFDWHYFIDTNTSSLTRLEAKLKKLPNSEKTKLIFRSKDCNASLQDLAQALKSNKYAALVLLDPFGMQINWKSIAGLKGTRSDVWILVPTGVIVNRLLFRSGNLPYIDKLTSFFGLAEEEIRKEFYKTEQRLDLFGDESEEITKVIKPINQIMRVYIRQLKTVWKFVTEDPMRLDNTKGRPLFHLVFASNNATAIKIAKDIIKVK